MVYVNFNESDFTGAVVMVVQSHQQRSGVLQGTRVPIWARQKDSVAFADVPRRLGGRMPDFCIIGAAKAGTSALYAMLRLHPQLFMNPLKEPNFFSTEAILSYGDAWYRGLYADASPDQLCGEASTSYTRYPLVDGTAERMASANPDMKLIYLLREPVARVESDCLQLMKYIQHALGMAVPEPTLDAFLEAVEDPDDPRHVALISTSRYIDQIEAFEAVFPREQMLLLFQEDLRQNADAVLQRIFDFLGVSPLEPAADETHVNVTADFVKGVERMHKTDRLKRLPFYETAKRLLPSSAKTLILGLLPKQTQDSELQLSDAMRMRLRDTFREPNRRLKERLGDLPQHWGV